MVELRQGHFLQRSVAVNPANSSIPALKGGLQRAGAAVIIVSHGGEVFQQEVTPLDEHSLQQLESCLKYAPQQNTLSLHAARACLQVCPTAPHVLLCDTAFFAGMPPAASAYPLPLALYNEGVRRYGGDGICHAWAWRRAKEMAGKKLQRLVSIHLDEQPNVAAILNGKAVDTSLGFSRLEGQPSTTGCGDIDPSIPLLLREDGLSCAEIRTLLEKHSGWSAVAGAPLTLAELLAAAGSAAPARHKLALALLENRLVEAVGAAIAALEGVDMLLFFCEPVSDLYYGFTARICARLSFLGLTLPPFPGAPTGGLSATGSVQAAVHCYDPWAAVGEVSYQ
jgi:acetate kinase